MSYQDITLLILTDIVGDFGFQKFANNGGLTQIAVGITGYIGVIYYLHLFTIQTQFLNNII